jgi:hypothetical protein
MDSVSSKHAVDSPALECSLREDEILKLIQRSFDVFMGVLRIEGSERGPGAFVFRDWAHAMAPAKVPWEYWTLAQVCAYLKQNLSGAESVEGWLQNIPTTELIPTIVFTRVAGTGELKVHLIEVYRETHAHKG